MSSFFKWLDERTGFVTAFDKIFNWKVPAHPCPCRFITSAIVFAFLLQGITGLFLWAFYSPSAQTAWESVWFIQYQLPYGWLVRGIHHYSAQLLVAMLGLYILMTILHGSYRRPREFVYWTAVVMLLFALASCLTGDLLPWSLSGYFATMARVSFLQILPVIGLPLYKLVVGGPDPQFGTLTLTRFTLLHIAVFGGGGFVLLCLWKYFDFRSRPLSCEKGIHHCCALACAESKKRPFWSCEALMNGIVCVLFLAAVMVLVFQHSLTSKQIAERSASLPFQSYVGAELTSPADPGGSYDAARPEWSFRALYYESKLPIFSKIGMIYAIFVIPGFLAAYFFALPILGRFKILHYLILAATAGLFVVFCAFTYLSYWDDYKNPDHAPTFKAGKAYADVLKDRAVELCGSPEGISQSGALSLLKNDPFIQGPKLFAQHCASCHRFEPFGDLAQNADFSPIPSADPTAPNLYRSVSKEWIAGYMNVDSLLSDNYFGKTKDFGEKGSMVTYMKGRIYGGMETEDGSFLLNTSNGLIHAVIGYDAGPAYDILEAAFTEMVENEENAEAIKSGEYASLLKDAVDAKFNDEAFMAGLEPKLPKPVLDALHSVLVEMTEDEVYQELLADEDNITQITEDEDIAAFLSETYLFTLCGSDEPIPADGMKYINQIRDGLVASCGQIAEDLYAESQLTELRDEGQNYPGLRDGVISDMAFLGCSECHPFYGTKADHACDLRGYMSKAWLKGFVSDPTDAKYYGSHNDRMPAYHPQEGDALIGGKEIDALVSWMHGDWYRPVTEANACEAGTDCGNDASAAETVPQDSAVSEEDAAENTDSEE